MTVFFSSDQHFGHANILRYCERPFRDVDHQTEVLISNWNSVVTEDDVVWVLGDFSFHKMTRTAEILSELKGTKFLVVGNHDLCHEYNRDYHPRFEAKYIEAGFLKVFYELRDFPLGQHLVTLSHFPYRDDDRHSTRYAKWLLEDQGQWLIHGHTHGKWKVLDRQIDVGVDTWDYTPVSQEELELIISTN